MKKSLIVITMLLALGMSAGAASQKHRHHPQTAAVQVDSTAVPETVEAYSDTASTTTMNEAADEDHKAYIRDAFSDSDADMFDRLFGGNEFIALAGMVFTIFVLVIVFLLSPILILITVFYFINKNRRERYKLAQAAVEHGQPIPDGLIAGQKKAKQAKAEENASNASGANEDYTTGIRQTFLGIGLMIFFVYLGVSVGIGIGALVTCIGLGKVFVSKTSKKNDLLNDNVGYGNNQPGYRDNKADEENKNGSYNHNEPL